MPESDLLAHLSAIAKDVAIDPATESVRDFGRPVPLVRTPEVVAHPAYASFLAALEEHPVLGDLFPDNDEERGWIRAHRPSSLPATLINAALWDSVMDGDASMAAIESSLRSSLADLQRLVRGKPVKARVLVGFGAELPPGSALRTPWGTLRSRRPSDRTVLQAVGSEYDPERGSILEAEADVKMTVRPDASFGATFVRSSIEEERWQRMALAFLLADGSDRPPAAHPWCITQMQALGHGPIYSEFRQFRKGPRFETAADLDRLDKWIRLVANPRVTGIAVERAVSMAGRIVDHVDAFIDAVIVWESLFGAGQTTELTYRVSMTMACALSPDPAERVALQREIQDLYGKRSKVVHGRKKLRSGEDVQTRERAQKLTLDALRAVLERHPYLLGQDARAHGAFVLGAPQET